MSYPSLEEICAKCGLVRFKYHSCNDDRSKPLVVDLEPGVIYRRKNNLRTIPIKDNDSEDEMFRVEEK